MGECAFCRCSVAMTRCRRCPPAPDPEPSDAGLRCLRGAVARPPAAGRSMGARRTTATATASGSPRRSPRPGGRILCGVSTDQLRSTGRGPPYGLAGIRAACEEQLAVVEGAGSRAVLMASRAGRRRAGPRGPPGGLRPSAAAGRRARCTACGWARGGDLQPRAVGPEPGREAGRDGRQVPPARVLRNL
ncbi:DUF993 family protein [Actinacidiphila glaucinigra]|uniref:DUF993 family protein n=1 Tax=Actinacidiphila glaucinigra TaxID=235986 RepID=UPI0036E695F2